MISTPSQIDDAILAVVLPRWQKVAMIIGKVSERLGGFSTDGDVQHHLYAERIEALVREGRLIAQGNITKWRYSEVRLP
jgi:predicted transcriptional regulator